MNDSTSRLGRALGKVGTPSLLLAALLCLCLVGSPSFSAAGDQPLESLSTPSLLPILRDQWLAQDKESMEVRLFGLEQGLIPDGGSIPLDLQTAVQLALQQNLDLRAESYAPRMAAAEIDKAQGPFDTFLVSDFSQNTSRTPISSQIQSENVDYLRTNSTMADFGFRKLIQTGSLLELKLDLNRYTSNSSWLILNPTYTSHLNFSVSQPLLKNGGITFQTAPINIARNLQLMSEDRWQAFVSDTLATVIQAYWDLVFTFQNYEVRAKSLELAKELLRTTEVRVNLGSLAPVDLLQSRTGVAMREEELLKARNLLASAQDLMRDLLQLSPAPQSATVRIIPTETPPPPPPDEGVTLDETIAQALKNRAEYRALLKDLETKNLQIRLAENQLLPSLDVTGKIGLNGLGGSPIPQRDLSRWEAFLLDLVNIRPPSGTEFEGGWKKSFDELFSTDYYQYSVGVRFEMPLENTGAKASYRKAKLDAYKTIWSIRNLGEKVILDVKEAWRGVEINRQRILTSEATQNLAEQQLQAEQKRLSLGLSTNYQVLKMEEDYRNAQTNSLMAKTEYWKARARLQKASGVLLEELGVSPDQFSPDKLSANRLSPERSG